MAAVFEINKDENGKFFFNLKAGNGEVVASSQAYADRSGATKGIDAVKRAAAAATIKDLTQK